MRTTINALVGRQGGVPSKEDLKEVLDRARRLLADISALLELECDRLFEIEVDPDDDTRIIRIKELIAQTQKAMQTVLDIEKKAGLGQDGPPQLDLEGAREEILRRLARLTA